MRSILQDEVDAHSGVKRPRGMEVELYTLEEALRVFAGLASGWEDEPSDRDEYERRIFEAADRFRSRFGP